MLERVGAVARRDMRIQLSYQFGLLARFVEVVLFAATLFFISKLVQHPASLAPYGSDYFGFALVGVVVVSFSTLGLGAFTRTISDEQTGGTLEILLTAPVPLAVVLGGAFVVPLALTAVEILIYGVAAALVGTHFALGGIVLALPVLALTITSFCALGVVSAAFIVLTKRGDPFTILVTRVTTLLAGSLFPASVLPGWAQPLSRLVPAFYGLRAMRAALLAHAGVADIAGDVVVLAGFTLVLAPLSLLIFRRSLRVARVSGTLGSY
jgi:ABC-2 type transport system permease protein